MIGALARVNNNFLKLAPAARRYVDSLGIAFPSANPFHNILCQMVEVIHSIEESNRLMRELLHANLANALTKNYVVKAGSAAAAVEAPRGVLYYWVDIDEKGYVKNVNIMTPTAQVLAQLEDDIAKYIPSVKDLPEHERTKKLRAFIRAYDPCISCAVH